MMKKTFKIGGTHPNDSKISSSCKIEVLPLPKTVYVSMAQHLGAPAKPIVEVGAELKTGQVIAEPGGFISAFVHSPVTGTVKSIAPRQDLAGNWMTHIEITVADEEVWAEGIDTTKDIVTKLPEDNAFIIDRIKSNGVVGLGLNQVKLISEGLGFVPGSLAAFTIDKLGFVGVRFRIDNSLLIQRGGIGHDNHIIRLQNIFLKLNFKGAAVLRIGYESIVTTECQGTITDLDLHAAGIEGQAVAHLIVQDIILGLTIDNVNGGLEIHGVADVGIVGIAPVTVGILLNLLVHSGLGVLFLDGHIRHGGVQRTQNAQVGLNQVITQCQIFKLNRTAISRFFAVIGNMLPVPFIFFFARKVLEWGADKPVIGKFFTFCLEKGHKGGAKLKATAGRGLPWALLLFVGIPLPGTGAWTGTLAASLLDMDFKSSVRACMGGVLLAGCIMGALSVLGVSAFGAVAA